MAEWTTPSNRGKVMAFWATCYQVGGIAATALAVKMLALGGWRWSFFGPAALIVVVGILVLVFVRTPRESRALDTVGSEPTEPPLANEDGAQKGDPSATIAVEEELHDGDDLTLLERRAAQRRVIRDAVLWCYGASYFFIKFVRYTLLFWLPYYLFKELGYSKEAAGWVSMAFDAGGIVGVIALGTASDRLRHYSRSLLAAVSLLGLALALVLYTQIGSHSMTANVVGLALIGAALFGPDSLISGAAAQDAGGRGAAATATGFVNGLGSIGAMLEGILIPQISLRFGWSAMIPTLAALAFCAALMLLPTLRRVPSS